MTPDTAAPGPAQKRVGPTPLIPEAVRRTARKVWRCECPGNGHENCPHPNCMQDIRPGDLYVEYIGEAAPFSSGTHYCAPCGFAEWTAK